MSATVRAQEAQALRDYSSIGILALSACTVLESMCLIYIRS